MLLLCQGLRQRLHMLLGVLHDLLLLIPRLIPLLNLLLYCLARRQCRKLLGQPCNVCR